MAAKATTTIRQVLRYQPHQAAWFAATQALFNQVVAFYFEASRPMKSSWISTVNYRSAEDRVAS